MSAMRFESGRIIPQAHSIRQYLRIANFCVHRGNNIMIDHILTYLSPINKTSLREVTSVAPSRSDKWWSVVGEVRTLMLKHHIQYNSVYGSYS